MNKPFYRKLVFFFLMALLLNACTTMTTTPSQQALNTQQWVMQGRIAIKTAQQGENASFIWHQQGQQYALRIFGPLGIGAVQLQGQPNNVILITSDGHRYQATSAEILLQQTIGWHLPVSNLVYWIRGMPAPHIAAQRAYDTQHRLLELQQQGWTVNYLAYQSDQATALPRLLTLQRENVVVKIVIDSWQ